MINKQFNNVVNNILFLIIMVNNKIIKIFVVN